MTAERRAAAPFAWIAALAFASGFPFGLINEALPVYLRSGGANLVDVGLVAAATFPWTFKFLWAPILDRIGTRKQWIAGCLILLALVIPLIARVDASQHAQLFFALIVLAVTLSATQDVAIDAFTIQATPRAQLGVANSVRIGAYRAAMLVSGGALIWLAGRQGWPAAFTAATVVTALLAACGALHPGHRPGAATARPVTLAAAARAADTSRHRMGAGVRPAVQAGRCRDGPDDAAVLGRSRIFAGGDRRGADHRPDGGDGERRSAGWLPDDAMGNAHRALVARAAAGRVQPRLLGCGGRSRRRRP